MADRGLCWVSDARDAIHVEARHQDGAPASWCDVLKDWRQGGGAKFMHFVLDCGLDAVFWESAPLRAGQQDEPYRAVLLDAPPLRYLAPDGRPFAQIDRDGEDPIIDFSSLGHDACLIAPRPRRAVDFSHLIAFGRHASKATQRALWRRVAQCLTRRISSEPCWLSTSGLGVSWLHVRIDSRPKYYQYSPFRTDRQID